MNIEERILKLLDGGFDIIIGRHMEGMSGYHADVVKKGVDFGHDHRFDLWHLGGHGFTVDEALINGELTARGEAPMKVYTPSDFLESD